MDPRSATELGDPAGALDRLADATGATFPHIQSARRRTAEQIATISSTLSRHEPRPDISTCVFGSWAGAELTAGSDDDWAVLVNREFGAYDPEVLAEIVAAQAELGVDDRMPGAQGVFGVPIGVQELVGNIGLDRDTNTNLTRRMLLLLESRELHGSVRAAAVDAVLDRYLKQGVKDGQPPRFLLNDIVRYWRTICVDFEGKAGIDDPKWVTRNAKLRTSRKLLFAGGLIAVLLCHLSSAENMQAFLTRWFDVTPLDRLSAAFLHVDALDPATRAIGAYDRWIGLISSDDVRQQLLRLTFETRDESEVFEEIRGIGRELSAGLDALLFSKPLARLTRGFAIF